MRYTSILCSDQFENEEREGALLVCLLCQGARLTTEDALDLAGDKILGCFLELVPSHVSIPRVPAQLDEFAVHDDRIDFTGRVSLEQAACCRVRNGL
jgi:hypothetical protein